MENSSELKYLVNIKKRKELLNWGSFQKYIFVNILLNRISTFNENKVHFL